MFILCLIIYVALKSRSISRNVALLNTFCHDIMEVLSIEWISKWWSLKTFSEVLQCYKSYFSFVGVMPIQEIILFKQVFIFKQALTYCCFFISSFSQITKFHINLKTGPIFPTLSRRLTVTFTVTK